MRTVILSLILILHATVYAEVKTFFPPKHWEITIEANDFEPYDVLTEKAILGGRIADDFTVTVLVERVNPGTTVSEVREEYGSRALEFGQKETQLIFDLNDVAVLAFQWKADTAISRTTDLTAPQKKFLEKTVKNHWSYHGYFVKEDVAFDIHLSFEITPARKLKAEQILESFKVNRTDELKDIAHIGRMLDKSDPNTLNEGLSFAAKYPKNSDIYYILGDYCFNRKDYSKAQQFYLKSLENHKSQPILLPYALWMCYDGLGMSYGIQKQYEKSFVYLKKGYEIAQNLDDNYVASSAYNLACLYAETGDVENTIKYLAESVKLNPESKEQAKHDSSFANLKEDQRFKNLIYPKISTENTLPSQVDKELLEERVKEHLKETNVDLRGEVDDLFLLADIYVDEGNDEDAIRLYQKALSVDVWRLEYQLKLAKILNKRSEKSQAAEKARTVYEYAEEGSLIEEAKQFLLELGKKPDEKMKESHTLAKNIEVIIVPIGKLNQKLLREVEESLEEKMGIQYSVSEKNLNVGKIDRSYVDEYLTKVVERIEVQLPQEQFKSLLSELNLSKTALESRDSKKEFIHAFFKKIGLSQEEIDQFHSLVKKLENEGQYDSERLLTELQKVFKATNKPTIKGYLGITEADIFTKDYNFLYGWARQGYGIISYQRFRSDFTEEPPNRPRLCNRTVKQGISSSFFILGIPRCSTPTCARAYPHSLTEHDQKSIEICRWCKEQLSSLINKYN